MNALRPYCTIPIFGCLLLAAWHLITCAAVAADAPAWLREGRELVSSGHYQDAIERMTRGLAAEHDFGIRCDAHLLTSAAYQRLGFHDKAIVRLDDARISAAAAGDAVRETIVRMRLSDLYLSVGELDKGETLAFESLQAAVDLEHPAVLADALNNWGNALVLYGDYPDAVDAYSEALEQSGTSAVTAIGTRLNLARAAAITGDHAAAASALDHAVEAANALPEGYTKATMLLAVGLAGMDVVASQSGRQMQSTTTTVVWKALQAADFIAQKSGDARLRSQSRGSLGRLYESQRRYTDALRLTNTAIFHAQQGNHSDLLYQWQWQAGRILRATGSLQDAVAAIESAVATLGPIRNDLATGYRQSNTIFETRVKPVYYDLAASYIELAESAVNQEESQKLLRQACGAVEKLKSAELEEYFQDECVAALQKKQRSLDTLKLDKTAVVYPIILPDRLVTLVLYPDGQIRHYVQTVPADTVRTEAIRLRRELQTRATKLFMYPARTIYDWIIRPANTDLEVAAIRTIVVVPDGVLRLIPFATLHDGKHFLAERYSVATTPSLTLTDPQPLRRDDISVMIAGLSHGVQGYSALPGVSRELGEIQDVIGGETILNEAFSSQRVYDRLRSSPYRIMHLATHGEFGSHPDDSYLLTYDSKLTMNKLESLIKLGAFRDDPLELLTLSACRTAVGDEKSALGLAGVAVKSGARSAIATLWYVNDEATMIAITEFYRQLQHNPGLSKAEALQNAQKKLIAQDRYWHPAYWGPFLLIGNWL